MAARIKATVTPAVLRWARERSRISLAVAAKRAAVAEDSLESWEKGESLPTLNQARKLANLYKRPLAIFYLPEPPLDFDTLKDFRRLPESEKEQSPALAYEIRRAHQRREAALELFADLNGEDPPALKLRIAQNQNPEEIGLKVRQLLGVSIQDQTSWNTDHKALNGWRSAIESKAILVFQASKIDVEEMRGFSINDRPFPVIVLNIADHPLARAFTLLHELAHVLLSNAGICDLHEKNGSGSSSVEVFCNHVAGATLLPHAALTGHSLVQQKGKRSTWNLSELGRVSKHFCVSREVVLRRLLEFDLITQQHYRSSRDEILKQWKQSQLAKSETKSDGGFAPPDVMAVARAGKFFTRLVLNGYRENMITGSDVSDYLEVKLKHLGSIREQTFGESV